MKKLLFILIIFSIYLTSCKQCEPTFIHVNIRDTIIKVIPKIIIDSGKAQIVNDTLIQYVSVKNNDTIIKIKYYPKTKLVNVYAKPEPEYITYRDTVTTIQIKEVIKDTPIKDITMYAMGLLLLAGAIYIFILLIKSKQ